MGRTPKKSEADLLMESLQNDIKQYEFEISLLQGKVDQAQKDLILIQENPSIFENIVRVMNNIKVPAPKGKRGRKPKDGDRSGN